MGSDWPSRRLAANVSDQAHDAWHSFARYHGVSVSALLEAIGRRLPVPSRGRRTRSSQWDEVVAEARSIDAERRGHGGRPPGS